MADPSPRTRRRIDVAEGPPRRDTEALTRRVVIEHLSPEIDDGRFPVKRIAGDRVMVGADVFADGHDAIAVRLRVRREEAGDSSSGTSGANGRESPMVLTTPGSDHWSGQFDVDEIGWYEFQVVAWIDHFRSWRRDLAVKFAAGQDVGVELLEGSLLVRDAAARATERDAHWLLEQADALSDSSPERERVGIAFGDGLDAVMTEYVDQSQASASAWRRVWVDRERARFGAWYEMFPRSAGPDPSRSATFREAALRLPAIADLGFDVVYLPPIHPIGRSFRKGRNNSPVAGPDDPGSPWAIGSAEGGHTAIDPGLGGFDDFHAFRREAERLGLEVALDLAWQCSPDHPWVAEHPEWFRHRPDGSVKYAENPPKKYQDIYPLDFACDEWPSLWRALLDVTLFWIGHGVRIFRVDNPHTKTFGFWEWLIDAVHTSHPETIFLSEAFTRPRPMRYLAKAGFTQSYTYFTWRTSKSELTEYFSELTAPDVREYLRPNLFANTPDILHEYLQRGGRPAFEARFLLAATLGASYGIYSGFELCEADAVPGTEEYADSEKYQFRTRDWNRPGHLKELIARVNGVRRAHPALQYEGPLRFHQTDNPHIIAFSKTHAVGRDRAHTAAGMPDTVLTVINLDPHRMQHGHVQIAPEFADAWGLSSTDPFTVHDLLDDRLYEWRGEWHYVRLDPGVRQGHLFVLARPRIEGTADGH